MQSNLNNQSQAQKITLQAQKENTKEDRKIKGQQSKLSQQSKLIHKETRFRSY